MGVTGLPLCKSQTLGQQGNSFVYCIDCEPLKLGEAVRQPEKQQASLLQSVFTVFFLCEELTLLLLRAV